MSQDLLENKSTIHPKKGHQKDAYQGSFDPVSKKRHGKGTYQYKNKFFQYSGQYENGKKQGQGTLKFADGTEIKAHFENDQISGEGVASYPDGSVYKGQFHLGERQGKGDFDSRFDSYSGMWKENMKQGEGVYCNKTTGKKIEGTFRKDKPHGSCEETGYNYSYKGEWNQGMKEGQGVQISDWMRVSQFEEQLDSIQKSEEQKKEQNVEQSGDFLENSEASLYQKQKNYDRFRYEGNFKQSEFQGQGKYESRSSKYTYSGNFSSGLPCNYPNQIRVQVSSVVRNQDGSIEEREKALVQNDIPAIEYELESEMKNIYIDCVYQGPPELDEVQPTEQEIEQMTKNWQNENKKNKNPPPMPDFRAPRMKHPDLILIQEESFRDVVVTLQSTFSKSISGINSESGTTQMKVDYRKEIEGKRAEFEKIKEEQRANEQEDPKKKGGKKDPKSENEFKVNLYKEEPSRKQTKVVLLTEKGSCCLEMFELPDDFPVGKYHINLVSQFQDFGKVKPRKIELNVKAKVSGKKK